MTKSHDVTYERQEYIDARALWDKADIVCSGEEAVKAAGSALLPLLNPDDKSKDNEFRYERYKERAVFYEFTARTLDGFVGAVFKKEPSFAAPESLEYLNSNVDGQGISLIQQSKEAIANVMKKGRHGLFVNYPLTERATTAADRATGSFNATIQSVPANAVVNWQTVSVGSQIKLSLVVIREIKEEVTSDGFGIESEDQYRVLKLVDDTYQVEVWRKNKDGKSWQLAEGPFTPTKGNGEQWNEIPFTFIGAENNDSRIDKAPLRGIVNLNIAHYRNSADYEDSVFYSGQAQSYITELDEEWRDWLEKQGIYVGSRTPLLLPKGSQFGYAQVEPNQVAFEAMKHKEEQAKALGARLLEKGTAVKTATEAQGDNESEHSVLSLVVSNVNDAYQQAIEWAAEYMNTTEEVTFTINRDFLNYNLDPQVLTALVGAWQTGELISKQDIWKYLRKVGFIDPEKTDEEIEGELELSGDGLGLDEDEGGSDGLEAA